MFKSINLRVIVFSRGWRIWVRKSKSNPPREFYRNFSLLPPHKGAQSKVLSFGKRTRKPFEEIDAASIPNSASLYFDEAKYEEFERVLNFDESNKPQFAQVGWKFESLSSR